MSLSKKEKDILQVALGLVAEKNRNRETFIKSQNRGEWQKAASLWVAQIGILFCIKADNPKIAEALKFYGE